ncbi:MAG: hypothetical protein RL514_4544 [Verrucomicrobiota bacterium]|jgi:uncharacterized membrane protein
MNLHDIQRLHADGFLAADQRDRIIAHYKLQDGQSKFVVILSIIGALLVASGIILLISANWNAIPRGVKLLSGLALMLGAHAAGAWTRSRHADFHKTAEALHLVGSVLFLANIALIGQVYHLSSRPPNAILVWWVGIAPLAWLLRSKLQYVLTLSAAMLWLLMEFVHDTGWFHWHGSELTLLFYPAIFTALYAAGVRMERSPAMDFSSVTRRFGLLGLSASLMPLLFGWHGGEQLAAVVWSAYLPFAVLVVAGLGFALRGEAKLPLVWRGIWFGTLTFWLVLVGVVYATRSNSGSWYWHREDWVAWLASLALFGHCLVMVNLGLLLGSRYLINLGLALLTFDVIIAYARLFGSMAVTGAMFIVSGVGLIVLGIFIEKRRRTLLRDLAARSNPPQP